MRIDVIADPCQKRVRMCVCVCVNVRGRRLSPGGGGSARSIYHASGFWLGEVNGAGAAVLPDPSPGIRQTQILTI